MGRLFLVNLEGKIYSCKHCHTHLALCDSIVSKVPFFFSFLIIFCGFLLVWLIFVVINSIIMFLVCGVLILLFCLVWWFLWLWLAIRIFSVVWLIGYINMVIYNSNKIVLLVSWKGLTTFWAIMRTVSDHKFHSECGTWFAKVVSAIMSFPCWTWITKKSMVVCVI